MPPKRVVTRSGGLGPPFCPRTGSRWGSGTQAALNFHLCYPARGHVQIAGLRNSSIAESSLRMAPIVKKRARLEVNSGSRKRQKNGKEVNKGLQESSTRPVSLDSLPWQEVAFPENGFEDAEGFFGLEEISDVKIVKDTKLGKVEYRVCQLSLNSVYQTTNSAVQISSDLPKSKPQEMISQAAKPKHTKDTAPWGFSAEDDQWEGFEEVDEAKGKDAKRAPEIANAGRDARDIKLKPKGLQGKDRKDVSPKQTTCKALINPFDALTKMNDDTDAVDEIDGKQLRVLVGDSTY